MITRETSVVIIGGGPGGYEAALVAARLGATVTVVERHGVGGAAVLTDCVPSKALIATADYMSDFGPPAGLGVRLSDDEGDVVDDASPSRAPSTSGSSSSRRRRAPTSRAASRTPACGSSAGRDRVARAGPVVAETDGGDGGARRRRGPRRDRSDARATMPTAVPDGERILTWQQIYSLDRAARAHRRHRLGRHRRRARPGVPRPRLAGRPRLVPRPGAARARTPTRRRSSRRCSASAGWRCSSRSRAAAVERTDRRGRGAPRATVARSRAATPCSPSVPSLRPAASGSRSWVSS